MKKLKLKVLSIIMTLVMLLGIGSVGAAAKVESQKRLPKNQRLILSLTGIQGPGLTGKVDPNGALTLVKNEVYTVDYTIAHKQPVGGADFVFVNPYLQLNPTSDKVTKAGRKYVSTNSMYLMPGDTEVSGSFEFRATDRKSLIIRGGAERRGLPEELGYYDQIKLTYDVVDGNIQIGEAAIWYFATHLDDAATNEMNLDKGQDVLLPKVDQGFPAQVRIKSGAAPTFTSISGTENQYSTDLDAFEYMLIDPDTGTGEWMDHTQVQNKIKSVWGDRTVTMSNGDYAFNLKDNGISAEIIRVKKLNDSYPAFHIDCWIKRDKSEGLEIQELFNSHPAGNPIMAAEADKHYVGKVITITPPTEKEDPNDIGRKYPLTLVIERGSADEDIRNLNEGTRELKVSLGKAKKNVEIHYSQGIREIDQCSIFFFTNGGLPEHIETQRVMTGETAKRPEDPTKEGHQFLGWFEHTTGKEFDFNTPIDNDYTWLVARWVELPSGGGNPGGGDNGGTTPPGGGDNGGTTPPGGGDNGGTTPPGGGDNGGTTPPGGGDNGGGNHGGGGGNTGNTDDTTPPVIYNPVWIEPIPDTPVITDNDQPITPDVTVSDDTIPLTDVDEDDVILTDDDTITEDAPPMSDEVVDDDVPLADLPKTGSMFNIRTYALAAVLISGTAVLVTTGFKKKEE